MSEIKVCAVEECKKPARPRERHCSMHEARLRRYGRTGPGPFARGTVEERFWRHVVKGDGCWDWAATKNGRGYAMLGRLYAHRISYEIHHGPIPDGSEVMHSCDNPPCTNPAHLSTGTHTENMRDAANKGRLRSVRAYGEANKAAKLTDAQVREIRRLRAEGVRRADVAKAFGVREMTISEITSGKSRRSA